ncbi:MAG TPA: hypothetical protein VIP46_05460, partial [Pyrinomonadaceae bacterium]
MNHQPHPRRASGRGGRRLIPAFVPAFLIFAAAVAYAATTFLVVSPTNLQGWQIQVTTAATATPTPSVTFVNGPATPPLGTGSAEFRIGANGNDAAQLRHPGFAGTRLPNPSATATPAANELSSLSYATFTQQDGSGGQSPYIILQIDTDGDAGIEDLLFFEPAYQSATFCPSNPQPALVTGQWQTWDAFDGCWYSVFGTAGSGPGTNTVSLRTLSAALPTGVIANSSPSGLGGVRLVTGFGAGAWDNYVGNADAFRIGVGANDTVYNFDPNQSSPVAGGLVISEFRARGPAGAGDEFVEIYNNSESQHVVSPPDGSDGYGVATQDGQLRCTVPFGTVIPARGHFLCAGSAYSLGGYAAPDAVITGEIADQPGLALFATTNPANFNGGTRLDAAGYASAPALYREGAGFQTTTPGGEIGGTLDYSFLRNLFQGRPMDTDDNNADFISVSTSGTATSIGQRLGAPGPENLASPVQRNDRVKASLIDPMVSFAAEPNSVRKQCAVAEECNPLRSANGTFSIRRRFTNNTGEDVTQLRFRLVNVTTLPQPAGTADLRAISSSQVTGVTVTGGSTVDVEGTTLEAAPPDGATANASSQPLGGGINSTLAAGTVTMATPLAPGASVNLQFLLGVQQPGAYNFFVNVEAGPGPASGALSAA